MEHINSVRNVPNILNPEDTFQSTAEKHCMWSMIFICKFIITCSWNDMTVTEKIEKQQKKKEEEKEKEEEEIGQKKKK